MSFHKFTDPHSGNRKGIKKRGKSISFAKKRTKMYEEWKSSGAQYVLTFSEYVDKMEPFKPKKKRKKK